MLRKNIKAPAIKLPSTSNAEYSLKNSIGSFVIIYFYPKNDTPGCTLETNDFNKLLPQFRKLNCEVYGISKDSIESHNKFKKKYKLRINLLSDLDKKVLKRYKVWGKKKFMGREFMGVIRSTFLIDKKGRILKIWDNVKVKDHAKEVLKTLKKTAES